MRVKIGSKWYDSGDEMVMIQLTPQDKVNIANMHPDATKYAEIPDTVTDAEAEKWMKE